MVNIMSALLFTLSANLDSVAVGIAYGIKKIKIGLLSNLFISSITVLGTLVSMLAGKGLTAILPSWLTHFIGAGVILVLGLYLTVQSMFQLCSNSKIVALKDMENMLDYAQKSDKDISGYIEPRETIAIGVGLTLNNVGMGIAAGAAGVGIWETVVFTAVFSLFFITFGIFLGNKIAGSFIGKYSALISGIMLLGLGIVECIW